MKPATPLSLFLAASLATPAVAADSVAAGTVVNVSSGGAPLAGLEVVLSAANTGRVSLGRSDAQGDVTLALNAANLGKARVQVVSEDCPGKDDRAWLIGPGGQLPPAPSGCNRKVLGAFFWGAPRVSVDLMAGVAAPGGGPRYAKVPLALTAVGGVLTIYGLVGKKDVCGGQDLGPSCNERRTGILVAGLVLTAGGVALWKFGKDRSAVGEAVFVPGGVMVRQRIGF